MLGSGVRLSVCPVCILITTHQSLAVSMRRSVIIAELRRPEVARIGTFSRNFCVVFEKRPLMIKIFKILFGKFTSRHRSTLLCAKFVKIVRREIGEIVRYLPDQKTFFGSLSNCGYCADRAQSLPWPAPNMCLTTFQISSKSVHFRRSYIAGRVKAVQNATRFQVLGKALSSRRVKSRLAQKKRCRQTSMKAVREEEVYGRAAAVGPRLLIRQGKSLHISQLTSISTGHWLHYPPSVDAGGSSYSSAPSTDGIQ